MIIVTIIIVLLLLPSVCFANAGTSLMYALVFQLFFINAFIGILEFYMIKKLSYKIPYWGMIITIFMNYVTMFLGIIIISYILDILKFDIYAFGNKYYNLLYITENVIFYIGLTICSAIMECFFIKFLIKKKLIESLIVSFKINFISSIIVACNFIIAYTNYDSYEHIWDLLGIFLKNMG